MGGKETTSTNNNGNNDAVLGVILQITHSLISTDQRYHLHMLNIYKTKLRIILKKKEDSVDDIYLNQNNHVTWS